MAWSLLSRQQFQISCHFSCIRVPAIVQRYSDTNIVFRRFRQCMTVRFHLCKPVYAGNVPRTSVRYFLCSALDARMPVSQPRYVVPYALRCRKTFIAICCRLLRVLSLYSGSVAGRVQVIWDQQERWLASWRLSMTTVWVNEGDVTAEGGWKSTVTHALSRSLSRSLHVQQARANYDKCDRLTSM